MKVAVLGILLGLLAAAFLGNVKGARDVSLHAVAMVQS